MAKNIIGEEPMLEERSNEILLEETTNEESLLEESEESEVMLEESSDEVLLEESADSETLLEESRETEVMLEESSDEVLFEESANLDSQHQTTQKPAPAVSTSNKKKTSRKQSTPQRNTAQKKTRKAAEEDPIRKAKEAEEAKRVADALMLKLQEEKKEKNSEIIFIVSVILSISSWVFISIAGWENSKWYVSILISLIGAVVAMFVGFGTFGIIVGDEKLWKTILFRSVFALTAFGLTLLSIISGTFGLSTICLSMILGLFCAGFVMVFCEPSFIYENI